VDTGANVSVRYGQMAGEISFDTVKIERIVLRLVCAISFLLIGQ
jgi:hypothetical protein